MACGVGWSGGRAAVVPGPVAAGVAADVPAGVDGPALGVVMIARCWRGAVAGVATYGIA